MKKATLKLPVSSAADFAEYCFANEIRILLSWGGQEDFWGNAFVFAIVAVPEAKEVEFMTKYKNQIKP